MHGQAVSAGQDSAFTAFAARVAGGPKLLDEHYRCHPEIARFFNEEFYGGALRVLTDVNAQAGRVCAASTLSTSGRHQPRSTGGAYNRAEADAVVEWVLENLDEPGSLGVVTPFAAQAELIRDRLRARRRRALGGQGHHRRYRSSLPGRRARRDALLHRARLRRATGTARWVEEQRNLVNVAVSRARRALVVFADTTNFAETPVPTLHALVGLANGTTPAASHLTR